MRVPLPVRTTADGFSYRGHYYAVVSIDIVGEMLHIVGLETNSQSFWQSDLLSFLNNHVAGAINSHQKAGQFLKFRLKEYSPASKAVFSFFPPTCREAVRVPGRFFVMATRALPVHAPPPEV